MNMKRIVCIILCVLTLTAAIPFSVIHLQSTDNVPIEAFTKGVRDIQRQNKDLPASSRIIVKSKQNIDTLDSIAQVEGYNDLHILQFDSTQSAQRALNYYNDKGYIEYAQSDLEIYDCDTQVESSFSEHLSWGSEAIGTDDYNDYLANIASLPKITVAIIDGGVDTDHEFLAGRIERTYFNISTTGTADSEEDDKGHGTHVAGIIADNTNDNVKIRAYKCLNSTGQGTISGLITSIYKAIDDGANIINMSLNARGTDDALMQAVQTAVSKNICVCVSAGNNGKDASSYLPSNIEECITVAAFDSYGAFPSWTNYGKCVDIAAPGVSIYSSYTDGGYKSSSGTSMSTPFVAAGCAQILSKSPTLSPDKVCSILRDNGKTTAYNNSVKWENVPYLYLGSITEFDGERTAAPKFSIDGGRYSDKLTVELSSDDANANIYYTADGSRASSTNGTLYTGPINLDSSMKIQAVAYSDGKIKSLQSYEEYYIVSTEKEESFTINEDGIITAYSGSELYFTIPDVIDGITVKGLGNDLFKFSDIEIIILPDSTESIGSNCFRGCTRLKAIDFKGNVSIGGNAFRGCESLNEINTRNIVSIEDYSFYGCSSMLEFVNDKITHVGSFAFAHCINMIYANIPNVSAIEFSGFFNCAAIKSFDASSLTRLGARGFSGLLQVMEFYIPRLTTLESYNDRGENFASCERLDNISLPIYQGEIPVSCFNGCQSMRYAYIPKATALNTDSLKLCKSLEAVYAPSLQSLSTIIANNITLFAGNDLTSISSEGSSLFRVCAPSMSTAQSITAKIGLPFSSCESCTFTSTNDCESTYIDTDCYDEFNVPNDMLKQIWHDSSPINKSSDCITHGFLINTVPDNIINAKDYSLIIMQ